ncbi:MAG: hypothetical protein ACRDTG_12740 [Pseudonocardiaceae bacterium]
MVSSLDIKLILCDAAQAEPNGKTHMLGAGWSITATPTAPHAVAILIKVPWERANQKIGGMLRLLDAEGDPVELEISPGMKGLIENEFELEVGRSPALAAGSMIDAAIVVNIGPMPLPLGCYQWCLEMDNRTEIVSFTVANC